MYGITDITPPSELDKHGVGIGRLLDADPTRGNRALIGLVPFILNGAISLTRRSQPSSQVALSLDMAKVIQDALA
jgi:hypothetical protein